MAEHGPVCPECGGPIAETATFCMHCSADLEGGAATSADGSADESAIAWDDAPGVAEWDGESDGRDGDRGPEEPGDGDDVAAPGDLPPEYRSSSGTTSRQLLPDGFLTKTVTFVLAIVGGLTVGAVGAVLLAPVVPTGWAFLLVVLLWLGSTTVFLRIAPG